MKATIIVGSSADGKITYKKDRSSKDFSKLLHIESGKFLTNLREKTDAIVFTSKNIEIDNPNCKTHAQNYRIILDRSFNIDTKANILNNPKVIIFYSNTNQLKGFDLEERGATLVKVQSEDFIKSVFTHLNNLGLKEILIECGGEMASALIKEKVIDNIIIATFPFLIGGLNTPTIMDGKGIDSIEEATKLKLVGHQIDHDIIFAEYTIEYA